MKIITTIVIFIIHSYCVSAQIKSVKFDIKYNNYTELYDIYLVILEGRSNIKKELIQFNSQISLIAPKGSSIEIKRNVMPLNSDGIAMNWEISNYLENLSSEKNESIFSIKPNLNKSSFYMEMKEKDTIKLFSIDVHPKDKDLNRVRLYRNDIDASSKETFKSDFSNGFTLGGLNQIYKEDSTFKKSYSESTDLNQINIYPIPASDIFSTIIVCQSESKIKAEIYDLQGRLIRPKVFEDSKSNQVNLFTVRVDLPTGLYKLVVTINNKKYDYNLPIIR